MGFNFANPYADVTAEGAFTPESMAENEYIAQQLVYEATESANAKDEAAGIDIPPEWEDNPVPPDPSPTPPPAVAFNADGIASQTAMSGGANVTSGGPPQVGVAYTIGAVVGTDPGIAGQTVTVTGINANAVTFSTTTDWTAFDFTGVSATFTPV